MQFKWAHLRRLLRLLFRLVLVGLLLFGGLILGSNPISNEPRCQIRFIATLDGGGLQLEGLPLGSLPLGNLILCRFLRAGLRLGGFPCGGLFLGDLLLGRLLRAGLRLGGYVLRLPHHSLGLNHRRSLHLLRLCLHLHSLAELLLAAHPAATRLG